MGGKGVAILTSSTSYQYSFEQAGNDLSIYTRYLIEGIKTGEADLNGDGYISTEELHEYAERKVQETIKTMHPQFFQLEEGSDIKLCNSPARNPSEQYFRKVKTLISSNNGVIPSYARFDLAETQNRLGISKTEAEILENKVLEPFRKYRDNLASYELVLKLALDKHYPLPPTVEDYFRGLQKDYGLKEEDVQAIRAKLLAEKEASTFIPQQNSIHIEHTTSSGNELAKPSAPTPTRSVETISPQRSINPMIMLGCIGTIVVSCAIGLAIFILRSTEQTNIIAGRTEQTSTEEKQQAGGEVDGNIENPAKVSDSKRNHVESSLGLTTINQESRQLLNHAYELYQQAPNGDESLIDQAIDFLQEIPADNVFYEEAQIRINNSDIDKAGRANIINSFKLYNDGAFDKAVAMLQGVSENSYYFDEAQNKIKQWKDIEEYNMSQHSEASKAISAIPPNLTIAERAADNINATTSHWKAKQKELYDLINEISSPNLTKLDCLNLEEAFLEGDVETFKTVQNDDLNIIATCKEFGVHIHR